MLTVSGLELTMMLSYPSSLQGEGGVDAAVVELDALADPVRAAAQDHDLRLRRGAASRPRVS